MQNIIFFIEYIGITKEKKLLYSGKDCYFYMEPEVSDFNFRLAINHTIILSILNEKVDHVYGFCPIESAIQMRLKLPQSRQGVLKVESSSEEGLLKHITKEDWPIYVDKESAWVCIGNPEAKANAVEFIRNCIALIDETNALVALWLKLDKLPNFLKDPIRFVINDKKLLEYKSLLYFKDEHYLITEPSMEKATHFLLLNTLTLSVVDQKVVHLSGFLNLQEDMVCSLNEPQSHHGVLTLANRLTFGSYRIREEFLPVFVDIESGWICIGNPNTMGNAVEFIRNSIALIDQTDSLVSLWLKPDKLSELCIARPLIFIIDYTESIGEDILLYNLEEHSFFMESNQRCLDFEITINSLSLSLVDKKIVFLSGFCPIESATQMRLKLPQSRQGVLKVESSSEEGLLKHITKEDWPIYVDKESAWVCIGNPEAKANAVEFIRNCIALIDETNALVALWLKPDKLPV